MIALAFSWRPICGFLFPENAIYNEYKIQLNKEYNGEIKIIL